jgi:hypothetical protein
MIPVFERAKTVHDLDRAAIVIGSGNHTLHLYVYKEHKLTETNLYAPKEASGISCSIFIHSFISGSTAVSLALAFSSVS